VMIMLRHKIVLLILAISLSLVPSVSAAPNIVDMGPYKVYFDVGQYAGDYSIQIFPTDYSETPSGNERTFYRSVLSDSTTGDTLEIHVSAIDSPNVMPPDDMLSLKSIMNLVPEGFLYISSEDRIIDDNPGVVIEARSYDGKATEYVAAYTLTKENNTNVYIISSWPWYPDTAMLLDTIHVERRE
jgi:hypothetical protein